MLEEYLQIKKHDKTIQGHLHTHPKSTWYPGSELTFSESNIGLFLAAEDVFHICMSPQGNYLIMLRTEQNDPSREGIGEEAITAYFELAWDKLPDNLEDGMEEKPAIAKAVCDAMIEIFKKYNCLV